MLKPPIILPIAPSRYWLLAQCLLLVGIVTLSYLVGGKLSAVPMIVLGGALIWRAYLRQPKGVLSLTSTASLFYGRWLPRDPQSGENALDIQGGEEYHVRCDYLGPWLIGLYVGKQRIWLWPDSGSSLDLREVRKLLHRPGR